MEIGFLLNSCKVSCNVNLHGGNMSGIKQALPNGPLSVVLMQVQYSPIVQIEKYIPAMQDYLRKNGYPLFTPIKGDMVRIEPHGETEKFVLAQWFFSSEDIQQTVIIDSDRITFQVFNVQSYTYETILQSFLSIVKEFDAIVELSIFTRIGLRYINSILETPNTSWRILVAKEFQGPVFPMNVNWMENELCSFSSQKGVLLKDLNISSNFRLRMMQNSLGRKYPEDIQRIPLGEPEYFDPRSLVTYLDLDHYVLFTSAPKKNVFSRLSEVFRELHSVIEDVFFESLITDEAKTLWQ